ncbi:hypothetical protein SPI_05422 [Niveomyces insectorum RCEF 264]|uniref:DUF7136 domain-containing protein n=1 Tax=Niveomyces insectorum RCEF 264 TaxID=1081102 RepID=A0A167T7I6_9HYPO|nr:hypothetical protein SPI_05422 [Niveomyces insectorum RCEF 264]
MLFNMHLFPVSRGALHVATFLLLRPVHAVAGYDVPQTVKFNLLFPRNETYGVTDYMPVVFAISNTQDAGLLAPYVEFALFNFTDGDRNPSGYTNIDGGAPPLTTVNLSTSDPYYVSSYLASLAGQEGRWGLLWGLASRYCVASAPNETDLSIQVGYIGDSGSVSFTTKKNAPPPDLVAGTANTSCASVPYDHSINITGVLGPPMETDSYLYPFRGICPLCRRHVDSVSLSNSPDQLHTVDAAYGQGAWPLADFSRRHCRMGDGGDLCFIRCGAY